VNPQSEHDRSIERLLRESLATTPGTGSCLDAEMLAAWVEGGLVGGQLIEAQEHVAGCSACQATLAALVRTTPTELGPEPWWRRALSARWLVPVAATATALAIWVLVPREEFMRPPEQLQTTAAREAAVPQTEASGESPAVPAEKSAAGSPIVARRPFEQPNAELRRDRVQGAAAADAREEQQLAAPLAFEPVPDVPATPALEGAQERQQSAPSVVGRATASAPAPAAPAPAEAGRFEPLQGAVAVEAQVTISSPGAAFRWRIGSAGSVEFSTDAGTTWELRPTGVEADLTAGTAPGGTVCWVVGRGGTVLLTTDGRQFRRLMFPVAADLAAVQAIDARSATVTAADGRRFRTMDAGATWDGL